MTPKEQKDFLIKLKEEINKSTEFICNYPTDKNIGTFIWVEKKCSMMGDDECHYEVIFNKPKNGNPDVASVEVHFEGDNFEDFQNIKLPDELMYAEWEYKENNWRKDSRIVYKDRDDGNNSNEDIIERLGKLDELIGTKLKRIVCKQWNYVRLKVNDTHYKKYKIFPVFSMVLFITACVMSVGAVITRCRPCFSIVATVGLLMLAALLFVLSVIVRLRTDDERWIRFKLKNSVVDSMNGKKLTKENCKILMGIMEL